MFVLQKGMMRAFEGETIDQSFSKHFVKIYK
jgi:hypothetical protein